MRKTLVLMAVLGLLAAMAAPAVGAPPGYEEVSTCETFESEVDGRTWETGERVLHRRGVTQAISIVGGEFFDGTGVLDININADQVTWKGNLWGSLVYSSTIPGNGWEATWHGQWTGPGTWEGSGVGRGFGEFAGMQWRFDVTNMTGDLACDYATSGYVFTPGRG